MLNLAHINQWYSVRPRELYSLAVFIFHKSRANYQSSTVNYAYTHTTKHSFLEVFPLDLKSQQQLWLFSFWLVGAFVLWDLNSGFCLTCTQFNHLQNEGLSVHSDYNWSGIFRDWDIYFKHLFNRLIMKDLHCCLCFLIDAVCRCLNV